MRSWYPIDPINLDNKRLLGEHNELLIIGRTIFGLNKLNSSRLVCRKGAKSHEPIRDGDHAHYAESI